MKNFRDLYIIQVVYGAAALYTICDFWSFVQQQKRRHLACLQCVYEIRENTVEKKDREKL